MRALLLIAALIATPAAAAKPTPPPGLAARVQRLEDVEQIRRVLVAYGRTLDRRDWAAYAALFAKDGEWVGGFGTGKGPAAIESMMRKAMGGTANDDPQKNFHVLTSFDIEVDGDHARAWSRWTFVSQGADNRAQILAAGRYEDELVRENGRWKFQRRVVSGDLPGAPPPGPLKP